MPPPPTLSPAAQTWLGEAAKALSQGQPDLAKQPLKRVLTEAPGLANAQFLYGIACQMLGDSNTAAEYMRKAAKQRPDDPNILTNLGGALYDSGATEEAFVHLRRATKLAPAQPSIWFNLGKALKLEWQLDEATDALKRALTLDERHITARITLADIFTIRGNIRDAVTEYRKVLALQPNEALAWHGLANLKTEPLSMADAQQIRQVLENRQLSPDSRALLGFSLYKALEDQRDYAGAFEALRNANAVKRQIDPWNAAAAREHANAIAAAFDMPLPAPVDPALGHEVIFIASLPRSGSTLVEHILASHPLVEGANEINDLSNVLDEESSRRGKNFPHWVSDATVEDWARLGKSYLDRTARWRAKRTYSTDKGLQNWQWVGAIRAMLPGAKIIDCHRDPVETCFACYRQLFSEGTLFSYDLQDLAGYYNDYRRLSDFWQAKHPGKVFDLAYEKLVQEPETQIRQLLAFCQLPFDAACLSPHQTQRDVHSTASAAQVRQPIRGDTARSTHYRDFLAPLIQYLDH
ncbi:tetratricopeptide repeat-containing sulfotransferase family protein [Dyella psychrodurans]|uniref:Sulfotransferase family protein n=1 Tax=Dyella psychrodurans TaxID=1927960 RepID=A0A370X4F3_9GAMM|nr:sulfotransferase [Dyella psychrodurans]RDS83303.1 sulfotransferase family protein [Dyella psychrodurans]